MWLGPEANKLEGGFSSGTSQHLCLHGSMSSPSGSRERLEHMEMDTDQKPEPAAPVGRGPETRTRSCRRPRTGDQNPRLETAEVRNQNPRLQMVTQPHRSGAWSRAGGRERGPHGPHPREPPGLARGARSSGTCRRPESLPSEGRTGCHALSAEGLGQPGAPQTWR